MSDVKRIVDAGSGTTTMHRAVDKMAELMKQELDDNAKKKGTRIDWLKADAMTHVLQTYYHTGKLQVAVRALEKLMADEESSKRAIKIQEDEVAEYAADVANHALMVLDVLGLLGLPPEKAKENKKGEKREVCDSDVGY